LIVLVGLVLLLTSLIRVVVVIEPRKTKIRTQRGEFLFVRIVERNIFFNYLDSDYWNYSYRPRTCCAVG